MINLYSAQIDSLSIHKVGNKSRNENVFLSETPYQLTDELTPLLKEYFFKPFREKEENYFQFVNEVDLEFNQLYTIATSIFNDPASVHENSKKIVSLLFEQSQHPHIKSGEVYVGYFENVVIDNEKVDAVGIFKSEIKNDFL